MPVKMMRSAPESSSAAASSSRAPAPPEYVRICRNDAGWRSMLWRMSITIGRLKQYLQGELDLPWRIRLVAQRAEQARVDGAVQSAEERRVRGVEQLSAQLHHTSFE